MGNAVRFDHRILRGLLGELEWFLKQPAQVGADSVFFEVVARAGGTALGMAVSQVGGESFEKIMVIAQVETPLSILGSARLFVDLPVNTDVRGTVS